ncbi:MAG: tetratricopeptide repeat protein [Bacteroidetes bacterium]|nr:tetratricopeptide repeat protein [Bacteroidota bacterium]
MVFSFIYLSSSGQVGVDYTLVKPKKFENRTLASEKSNNGKKLKKSRRFIQNTITHYNYWWNAKEKLRMILERAKSQFRDDYTRLLPFYNYTLDATLSQKRELDSIIYKCTAGILIHDTRNDWIDNLYLLIGQTYYFRKDFDSAYITLQFLNYAFAPKESDGYDKPIGSNANADEGGNANIVSTVEKRNLVQKALSLPPSRNDALVWKVRNYIAQEKYGEASALIEVLVHDPEFPDRLEPSLNEVRSLWFYRKAIYDSAAIYLEKALPAASNHEEVARWEYLIAQLYERVGRSSDARTFYERTIAHTYNPILEIYARLNAIRQNKEGGEDFIARNIQALVHMAHRDRYESYRDIIYYTAAQMELERNNKPGAESFLLLSTRYTSLANSLQRNRSFLDLANISFEEKKYRAAKNYYDSLTIGASDAASMGDLSWLPDRKAALAVIVAQLQVIDRQDSLQRIAAMPVPQRDAYIKRLVRTLRRQQGLRDESDSTFNGNITGANNAANTDMFRSGSGTADWYFNNPSLKAKGYTDFKTKWGNRPNVDNWQISSAMRLGAARPVQQGPLVPNTLAGASSTIDFKTLLANLPLTPEKMQHSMDSIEAALFTMAKTFQEGVPDYLSAVNTYDSLLIKFPGTKREEVILFNMYYCYKKLGDDANAARILERLRKKYPGGRLTTRAANPDSTLEASGSLEANATHQYEKVYLAYIEGRFDEAESGKRVADSLYGDKYWTPQLLYIESVYLIRARRDAQARSILSLVQAKWPKTAMAAKAANLLDVLNRRKEIEDYLTRLQVTRAKDEDSIVVDNTRPTPAPDNRPRLVRNDSNLLVRNKPDAGKPGAGIDKLKTDSAGMNRIVMDSSRITQLRQLQDSLKAAAIRASNDSAKAAAIRHATDSINAVMARIKDSTDRLAANLRSLNSVFSLTPDKPHSVLIVLNKVDPVYVNETKNAFSRYNTEEYYSQQLTTAGSDLTDSLKMVVIGSFGNADDALQYLQKAKALAPRQIVPWLPAGKYSFLIISGPNLDLLLNNKDLPAYRKFLQAAYPGKF